MSSWQLASPNRWRFEWRIRAGARRSLRAPRPKKPRTRQASCRPEAPGGRSRFAGRGAELGEKGLQPCGAFIGQHAWYDLKAMVEPPIPADPE